MNPNTQLSTTVLTLGGTFVECHTYAIAHLLIIKLTFNPLLNSTISSAWMLRRPWTRAIPSPMVSTLPVSVKSCEGAVPRILCSNIDGNSAAPVKFKQTLITYFGKNSNLNIHALLLYSSLINLNSKGEWRTHHQL